MSEKTHDIQQVTASDMDDCLMHLLPKLRRYILACVSETVTSGQRHTVVVSSGLREDPQSGNYILDFDIGVHPAQQVVVIDLPGSDEIQ